MRVAHVETEIGLAENPLKHVLARAQAVVVAQQNDKRHVQLAEDVALQFKFARHPKVADVAAVQHKVNVASRVDTLHRFARLVVPALRVADKYEPHRIAASIQLLNALDI